MWLTGDFFASAVHTNSSLTTRRRPGYLNRRLCNALAAWLEQLPSDEELERKPVLLRLAGDLPPRVRVYLYTATDHEAERNTGDYRIQIMAPGQSRGETRRFDRSDSAFPLLIGYVPEFDVFVLWDADLHDRGQGFPFSKGAQVRPETIYEASVEGLARLERRLRSAAGTANESVLAARPDRLADAIRERARIVLQRLLRGE